MKSLIILNLILVLAISTSTTVFAASVDSEALATYQASSAKFNGFINEAKFGTAGNPYATRYKQLLDNLISATVTAKNCDELLAASPTLRPGTYTVFPSGDKSAPEYVTCNPISTAQLILLLNGED